MGTRLAPKHLLLILCIVALWGYTFVPIKVALREVPPFALAALRFFFAAIPAVFFVKPPAMPLGLVVGYGVAIGVIQFGLLFLGMTLGMPAGLSSLVIQVQVFFTIGLAVAFTQERWARHYTLGAAVAGSGLLLLVAQKLMAGVNASFIGFLLILVAALAWAIGNVMAKHAAATYRPDTFALVVWSSLVPPLPLAALAYVFEGGAAAFEAVVHASPTVWLCVAVLSYGATLFAYASWNHLLHIYPTPLISPFALLIPVSGIGSGMLFLGETLSWLQAVAAMLVFTGLALNVLGSRLRRRESGADRPAAAADPRRS